MKLNIESKKEQLKRAVLDAAFDGTTAAATGFLTGGRTGAAAHFTDFAGLANALTALTALAGLAVLAGLPALRDLVDLLVAMGITTLRSEALPVKEFGIVT